MKEHPLKDHYLSYMVMAGDDILHSELVPGREILEFPSFECPPYTRVVDITIIHYGKGGQHISMVRKSLHPNTVKTALNIIPWNMLQDYLASLTST
jgi:hypothetical protein